MMPRTKLPIPEPTDDEFKNFDRVMRIIVSAPPMPMVKKEKPAAKKRATLQRRLPRP
jgi:hypothetical protein